jgi:hypothetical protein
LLPSSSQGFMLTGAMLKSPQWLPR